MRRGRLSNPCCVLHDELFPLVVATVSGEPTEQDVRVLLRGFEQLFARDLRYALIVDLSEIVRPGTAALRQAIAEWCLAHRAPARKLNVCTIVVGAGSLVRGALTALNWLAPFVAPLQYEASFGAAVDRCVEALEVAGIPPSHAIEQFRRVQREQRLWRRA